MALINQTTMLAAESREIGRMIEELDIRCTGPRQPVRRPVTAALDLGTGATTAPRRS